MATRNQRKAKAKARAKAIAEVLAAQQAKATAQELVLWRPKQDVFDVPGAIRGHREPIERAGTISRGKFVSKALPLPVKRKLTERPDGLIVERARGYFGTRKTKR